jgi:hypothetical protein
MLSRVTALLDRHEGVLDDRVQKVVAAGALAARVGKVDGTRLILLLEFALPADIDRVYGEIAGPGCAKTSCLALHATRSAASAK